MNLSLLLSEIGRQYARDDAFTARMRLHQGWWRAHVLGVECGPGPTEGAATRYGNMLAPSDGGRFLNYLTPEIGELAARRAAENPGGVKRHRALCNLLSSQPMCFNLFGPIALDDDIGPRLVEALVDLPVRRVLRTVIEHAPTPVADHLDDGTSFDAFIEFELVDGVLGFAGIETKLTEPFSQTPYPIAARPAYQRWLAHATAPWLPETHAELDDVEINQLWRDHALALAARIRAAPRFHHGMCVLVRHADDDKCARAVARYRRCLRPEDNTFLDRPLHDIVGRWRPLVDATRWSSWLADFERRYVDLSGSAHVAGTAS